GIYEKYIVRRGLNYVIDSLANLALNTTPNGGDPCVGTNVEAAPCTGLEAPPPSDTGYATSIAILPPAASGALDPHLAAIRRTGHNPDGFVLGKKYGEIMQRLIDAMAWGQGDSGIGRGGWSYAFNANGKSDGSTIGWNMLALLDGAAVGATIPSFVKSEFQTFA